MSKQPPGRPSKGSPDTPENYREAFQVRLSLSFGLQRPLNNLKARETYSKHVEYVLLTDFKVEL